MSDVDDDEPAPIRTRGPGHLLTQKAVDACCKRWANKLPPGKRELVMHDGNALNLIKRAPHGGFVWALEMNWAGKDIEPRLGSHPGTTLEAARSLAAKLRKCAARGKDPRSYLKKQRDKAAVRQEKSEAASKLTFLAAMEEAIKEDEENGESAATLKGRRLRLRKHFIPIHDVPLKELTYQQIKALVIQVAEKSRDTAERMWYDGVYLMKWAIEEEKIKKSPLKDKRPPRVVREYQRECHAKEHVYPAITDIEALGELRWLNRQVHCAWQTRDATDFQQLTGLRSSNVAKMRWKWYDPVEGTLTIPRSEMKEKERRAPSKVKLGGQTKPGQILDFTVALSRQLQAYLNGRTREGVYVFPSPRNVNKPITINTLSAHMRLRLGQRDKHVPHGARSAIHTWAFNQKQPNSPRLVYEAIAIEMILDHEWQSQADRSYTREEAIEIQRPIYQDFNDVLDEAERRARLRHEGESE